jgi:single-stranded-DNA-specific exonuclease
MPAPPQTIADAAPVRIRRFGEHATAPANLPALFHRLYAHRGDAEPAVSLTELLPAAGLQGIDAAAAVLADQVQRGGRILIVGDYDADGATGSAVALLGLRALGAAHVDHLTPSRFQHGYGLGPAVADAAAERRPDLIVTVDNGIASHAGVARAAEHGIPVLITDHHLPGAELPAAAAIVNPNQPGCGFASKHVAGCGVMFYLLAATRAELLRRGWFASGAAAGRSPPNLATLLDLVALGTVADVVTLDRNNRILVEQGLRRIRAGACRPGLRALLEIAGCRIEGVTARDLGFAAGPRLNAAGRLDDMGVGVECLTTDDPVRAMRLAQQLNGLNSERRELEHGILDEAVALVERDAAASGVLPAALCVYGAHWHEGVIGIVAARLRERWHRPTIVFADGADGLLRGSARSIEGLHIRDALDAVDKRRPDLIARFGGHAMAAGLTLPRQALGDFRRAFAAEVERELGGAPAVREILSDGELPAPLLTLGTAEALRRAGPWGKGFAEPVFDGVFAVAHKTIAADRHLKLRVRLGDAPPMDAIGFHLAEQRGVAGERVRLAYRLDINEYRGLKAPQLVFEHLEPVDN